VFHVNADKPESVVHAMLLAFQIRQLFGIDVYVDILGYRRYGHNEGDEPRFTQPLMYEAISKHSDVYILYLEKLLSEGSISSNEATEYRNSFKESLQEKLEIAKSNPPKITMELAFKDVWKPYRNAKEKDFNYSINTGIKLDILKKVAFPLINKPTDFSLYSKIEKLIENRKSLFESKKVDWALAEQLAFGSLLIEGHPVRLSGQDSQRGTFSHRHSVLRDIKSEDLYIPLNHIQASQEKFEVYNSLLSEYAVMGFEYGYSLACPKALVIWEAQFGDFSNGAQIIIDQFISSSEYKWQRMSGLVLMLPHGYEGQGPEHSSARPERYLQLCAEQNMYIANVTTPANLFHLLRRQVKNEFRKPLILLTPKSLLRHPQVMSDTVELIDGKFEEIILDLEVTHPKRVLLCTGKIYYELLEKRKILNYQDVAIVRIEQLYPLVETQLKSLKDQYKTCKDWIWVQDEPKNMGYWSHISNFLSEFKLKLVSRPESASPATGSLKAHTKSQEELILKAFS
jgi:2-oxoglutarate dehydrogenase E1 component